MGFVEPWFMRKFNQDERQLADGVSSSTEASRPLRTCCASSKTNFDGGKSSRDLEAKQDGRMGLLDEELQEDVDTMLEQSDSATIDLDAFPDLDLVLSPGPSDWVSALDDSLSKEVDSEFPLTEEDMEERKLQESFAVVDELLPVQSPAVLDADFEVLSTTDAVKHFENDVDEVTDEEAVKDEIELLQKEIKYLDAQKEFLQSRAKSSRPRRKTFKSKHSSRKEQKLLRLKGQGENKLLNDLIIQQKVYTESVKAMLTLSPVNDVRMTLMTPMESYIRLPKDPRERKRTILSLRKEKLDMAYQFIEHKAQGLDYNKPYQYSDMFDKFGKHYCVNFAISKYDGVSVYQVARAIYKQYAEEDETLNHALGTTAVRESFGTIRCNFMHQRVVAHVSSSNKDWDQMPDMESNGIFYCRFGENFAVLTTDYVDQDDLHPYDTSNHIRRDFSTGVVLSGHQDDIGNKYVVMKRFSMSKLHMYPHKVPQKQQNRFFVNMFNCHDTMNTLTIDRLKQNDKGCSCSCAGNEKGCSCCAGSSWGSVAKTEMPTACSYGCMAC